MTWTNVYESDFRLPEKVCVVAPGPRGKAHYDRIPEDYYLFAVSKAVLIPEIRPPDAWMMNHTHQDWFETATAQYRGTYIFGEGAMEEARSKLAGGENRFYYPSDYSDGVRDDDPGPLDTYIRRGTTVAGCAIQFCHLFGARKILLCGIDMSGDGYFDGTVNAEVKHGPTWSCVVRINSILRKMESEKGIRVATLSPTRLNVATVS